MVLNWIEWTAASWDARMAEPTVSSLVVSRAGSTAMQWAVKSVELRAVSTADLLAY